jgi:hypothetical protein
VVSLPQVSHVVSLPQVSTRKPGMLLAHLRATCLAHPSLLGFTIFLDTKLEGRRFWAEW